jgi:hypothetical protein
VVLARRHGALLRGFRSLPRAGIEAGSDYQSKRGCTGNAPLHVSPPEWEIKEDVEPNHPEKFGRVLYPALIVGASWRPKISRHTSFEFRIFGGASTEW